LTAGAREPSRLPACVALLVHRSLSIKYKPRPSVSRSVYRSVGLESVLWQNGWLDSDAVWSGEWGRGMGVLDGVVIVKGKGQFWVNVGCPIVINGNFVV